jgi:hypothetical protein
MVRELEAAASMKKRIKQLDIYHLEVEKFKILID